MSRLTVYPETAPGQPSLRTEDADSIRDTLAAIGIRFERAHQLDTAELPALSVALRDAIIASLAEIEHSPSLKGLRPPPQKLRFMPARQRSTTKA